MIPERRSGVRRKDCWCLPRLFTHRRRGSRQVCVRVCSAGFRQCPEHVDVKALLINTIRFSWELHSAFRVQDCGGSAEACALLFAHWLFPTSSPLNCSVLSCSRRGGGRRNTVSTSELIYVVYREYTGFAGSKKTALTCMTEDNASLISNPHNWRPHKTWLKLLIDTQSNASR